MYETDWQWVGGGCFHASEKLGEVCLGKERYGGCCSTCIAKALVSQYIVSAGL